MSKKDWMRYDEYVVSGIWRCSSSPTGAHHWVEMAEAQKLKRAGVFRCVHCNDVRKFITHFWSLESIFKMKEEDLDVLET